MFVLNLSLQIEHVSFLLDEIYDLVLGLVNHVGNLWTHELIDSTQGSSEASLLVVFHAFLMEQIILMLPNLFVNLYKITEECQSLSPLFLSIHLGLIWVLHELELVQLIYMLIFHPFLLRVNALLWTIRHVENGVLMIGECLVQALGHSSFVVY